MSGKLNIMNQKQYRFDTAFYSIEFEEKYEEYQEAYKALRKFYAKLVRIMGNARFHRISFGIGISNQDGKTATKTTKTTGNQGRPRITVTSKETKKWHLHCVVHGNGASSFCQEFIEYYRKKNPAPIWKKQLKTADGRQGADYVPYCYNQCISWFTHGTFDFSELYNCLTWKEQSENKETDLSNNLLELENLNRAEKEFWEADSLVLSYKISDTLLPKSPIFIAFSALRTVYVIITVLSYLIYLYFPFTTLEIIENLLERIRYPAIRLFHHAQNRFLSGLSIPRTEATPRQNEDYQSHTLKPWLSVRFSNARFLQINHHIFVATPCQFVLSL